MNNIGEQVNRLIINISCNASQPTMNRFVIYLTKEQKQWFENIYSNSKVEEDSFQFGGNVWNIFEYE